MAFGNAETDTPARSLATNVNGQANTNNSTRTDGATNMNIWLPNHNMLISPAETIDTVNVSTSSFDAEQGMAGGGAVTVITKSGTNQFRGSAFEFYNSDALNANSFYFGAGQVPKKLPLNQKTYGGTVGGPIAKNKVFFFGSFEGYKRTQDLTTAFTVPDEALRRGDFSRATNNAGAPQIIYNPFTGGANGVGRVPFEGNIIPSNLINPIALKVLQLYPLPNTTGSGLGGFTRNYERVESRSTDRDNYDVKVNWNRTDAQPDLGQVQLLQRRRGRPDELPRTRSECHRRRRIHQGVVGHGWPDLDVHSDLADGHDVRVCPAEAGCAWTGLQRGQLWARCPWHPRDERPGDRRSALRGVSRVHAGHVQRRSATATAGIPSSATSGRTRWRRTCRS